MSISWISAYELPSLLSEELSSKLNVYNGQCDTITDAVASFYQTDATPFYPLLKEDKTSSSVKQNLLLLDASMYAYRNYQDVNAYGNAIKHISKNDPSER